MKNIVLPALFIAFFSWSAAAQEYPLVITEQGYIFVEVTLNDSIKANFLLDTGAGISVLSSKTFEKIKNSTEKSGFFTGFRHDGDRLDGEVFTFPSLAVGPFKQNQVHTGVYPPLDAYGIDGLISMKFFEDKPFTIDFKNKKLRFLTPKTLKKTTKSGKVFPIRLDTHMDLMLDFFVTLCINDKLQIQAEFDTGSGFNALIINPYFIGELGLDESGAVTQDYVTPISGKKLKDYVFKLDQVGICSDKANVEQKNISAIFREDLIYEGLIGSGFFKEGALTIDLPGKKIIFQK